MPWSTFTPDLDPRLCELDELPRDDRLARLVTDCCCDQHHGEPSATSFEQRQDIVDLGRGKPSPATINNTVVAMCLQKMSKTLNTSTRHSHNPADETAPMHYCDASCRD